MNVNQLAKLLRTTPTVDSFGYPINTKRPIVFDQGGFEPHTELSTTGYGKEFGLPNQNKLYNVPTIYNGQIYDSNTFSGNMAIRQNVQQNPNLYPSFNTEQEAVQNAIQRSKDIGQLRNEELNRAVLMRYLEEK